MRRPQIILLLAALGVFVLLLLAPRTPELTETVADTYEVRLEKALLMVRGAEPMKGILELRKIADEDTTRAEAQWHLGRFAMQTGQFDKAAERFEKVVMIEQDSVPDAWSYLGQAHLAMGDTAEAIKDLNKYKTLIKDTVVIKELDRFLVELKDKSEQNAER